ncbi:MAG: hypothetical protein ACE5GQ_08615, partial [Nitrospinales bacterium]
MPYFRPCDSGSHPLVFPSSDEKILPACHRQRPSGFDMKKTLLLGGLVLICFVLGCPRGAPEKKRPPLFSIFQVLETRQDPSF